MNIIAIIPAYNEEKTISEVIKKTKQGVKKVIVVNDGSTDNTARIAEEAGAEVISFKQNKGLGTAFFTGIQEAIKHKPDIIVNLDADGQFNPSDIPTLIQPIIDKKADMVTATRYPFKGLSIAKKLGNLALNKMVNACLKTKFTDTQCLPHFSKIFCFINNAPFYGTFAELKDEIHLKKTQIKNEYIAKEKIKVFSLNQIKQKLELLPITNLMIIKKQMKLIKINLEGGRYFYANKDHPVLCKNFIYKKIKDLYVSDKLIIVKRFDLKSCIKYFDILDIFSKTDISHKIYIHGWTKHYPLSTKTLSKKLLLDRNRIQAFIYNDSIPLNYFLKIDNKRIRKDISLAYFQGRTDFPCKIKIDKQFMTFLGYYLSEGCMDFNRSSIRISFSKTEIKQLKCVQDIIKNLFRLNNSVYHTQECTIISIYSKPLCLFLKSLGAGINAKSKKIPAYLFTLPNIKIGYFIDSYLDGDGHIRQYPDSIKIYCNSASKDFIEGLQTLLLKLGITSSISSTIRSGKIKKRYIKKTKRWNLRIHGGSSLERAGHYFPSLKKYKFRQFDNKYSTKNYLSNTDKSSLNHYLTCSKIISIKEKNYKGLWYDFKIKTNKPNQANFMHDNGIISHNCGFRAYSLEAARALNLFNKYTYTQEVYFDLVNKGFKIKEIPLDIKPEREGKTRLANNLGSYIHKVLMIFLRTVRDMYPLKFFGVPGIIIFLFGFLSIIYLNINHFLFGNDIANHQAFLIYSVISLIFGFLLIVLALIADMSDRQNKNLERILLRLKEK